MKAGWNYGTLGDVLTKGSSNLTLKKISADEGGYPVFGAKGIVGSISTYQQEYDFLSVIKDGAGIGRVAFCPAKSSVLGTLQILIPKEGFDTRFLYYFLESIQLAKKYRVGSTIPHIYYKDYKAEPAPLPSLEEQKRIVAILDKAFAGINQAIANTEKNLKNARELFLSKKASVFDLIKQEEMTVPLESVCIEIFAGGDAPRENLSKEKTEEYNIPIFANAVKDNGLYGFTDLMRVTEPSVTVAARGSGTGHTEVRRQPFYPIVRLIVLTPDTEKMNVDFLRYAIQDLDILRSGSAIPQLTVPMIKGYSIPIPSLHAQKQAVKILDISADFCACLRDLYHQKLTDLDDLRQSLLQKAFAGELT